MKQTGLNVTTFCRKMDREDYLVYVCDNHCLKLANYYNIMSIARCHLNYRTKRTLRIGASSKLYRVRKVLTTTYCMNASDIRLIQ